MLSIDGQAVNRIRLRCMNLSHALLSDPAANAGIAPARLSLDWALTQGEQVYAVPGTTSLSHLRENMRRLAMPVEVRQTAGAAMNERTVHGSLRLPAQGGDA